MQSVEDFVGLSARLGLVVHSHGITFENPVSPSCNCFIHSFYLHSFDFHHPGHTRLKIATPDFRRSAEGVAPTTRDPNTIENDNSIIIDDRLSDAIDSQCGVGCEIACAKKGPPTKIFLKFRKIMSAW